MVRLTDRGIRPGWQATTLVRLSADQGPTYRNDAGSPFFLRYRRYLHLEDRVRRYGAGERMRTAWLVLAALLAGLAGLAGRAESAGRPDVLLVTIDTLRADRLSCYGAKPWRTPEIARLASDGVVFEAALAPMPLTRPSHFTILSSQHPRGHGVVNNQLGLPGDVPVLTEVLQRAGYRTAAFIGTRLLDESSGGARGFDHFEAPTRSVQPDAPSVVRPALDWLAKLPDDQPFFLWLHLFDPHMPYAPPLRLRPEESGPVAEAFPVMSWERLVAVASKRRGDVPESVLRRGLGLYAGEVRHVDEWLGRLFQALRDGGRLDRTVVALTADHGECFENGVWFDHAGCLGEGAVRVPLVVRFPGRVPAGGRRPEVVELSDVAPTLLALAGLTAPDSFEGRRLFDPGDPPRRAAAIQHPVWSERALERRRPLHHGVRSVKGQPVRPLLVDRQQLAWRTRRWKLVRTGEKLTLHRVDASAGEARDHAAERPELARRLAAELARWEAAHPIRIIEHGEINDRLLETLRALGYVE